MDFLQYIDSSSLATPASPDLKLPFAEIGVQLPAPGTKLSDTIRGYVPPPNYSEPRSEGKSQNTASQTDIHFYLGEMNRSISAIRVDFHNVRLKVRNFDTHSFRDDKGNSIPKLETNWMELSSKFEDLLTDSYRTASAATHLTKRYSKTLLSIKNREKGFKDKLDRFIERVNKAEAEAVKYKSGFERLSSDIKMFIPTMNQAALDADEHLNTELRTTAEIIKNLQKSLTSWNRLAMHANLAGYKTRRGSGFSGGCLLLLAYLNPSSWFKSQTNVGQSDYFDKRISEVKNDLLSKREHMKTLLEGRTGLEAIKAQFEIAATQVAKIQENLEPLSSIWGVLRHDAQMLSISITDLKEDEMDGEEFQGGLDECIALYEMLEKTLETYAKNIPSG